MRNTDTLLFLRYSPNVPPQLEVRGHGKPELVRSLALRSEIRPVAGFRLSEPGCVTLSEIQCLSAWVHTMEIMSTSFSASCRTLSHSNILDNTIQLKVWAEIISQVPKTTPNSRERHHQAKKKSYLTGTALGPVLTLFTWYLGLLSAWTENVSTPLSNSGGCVELCAFTRVFGEVGALEDKSALCAVSLVRRLWLNLGLSNLRSKGRAELVYGFGVNRLYAGAIVFWVCSAPLAGALSGKLFWG